ncbi:hypothetical protein HZA98_02640 [Candidatus Woesearchaeota archaeon]|nr:hypothetical protein [Candidatus Woesearchaeota archaeon]
MKKLLILFFTLILLTACSIETTKNTHEKESFPPIYVSIVTHIEQPPGNPDYFSNEDIFWQDRDGLINFADMLAKEKVKYNFGSDWNFLLAAKIYDKGTASTNGKNAIKYMKEDLNFEIDPHAHESTYNYADVAYLIQQLGVTPSNIASGFIESPPQDAKIEYFRNELKGKQYPSYSWKADIIWGGGTSSHKNEEDLWVSGIWRPKNDEHPSVNDENAPLPEIGRYENNWDGLDELLQLQKEGKLTPGKIYTIGIFTSKKDFDAASISAFKEKIESYKQDTNAGRIKWVGLNEVYNIWVNEYGSESNQLFYTDIHSSTSSSSSGNCGDGVCDNIEKKSGKCPEDC